jgi:hypothetical protein
MAIINTGTNFSNGEQLSASKLNALINEATFGTDSVDNSTTLVNANGAITVRDSGITAAKLATNAVTTAKIADANVTTAKIADANVTTSKIADANVTTSKIADANVTFAKLTDVIDDDTMATATATTLATSESIKAYVDATPSLQGSTAIGTLSTAANQTFTDLDLSSTVGSNKAMVIMEVSGGDGTYRSVFFRTKGSSVQFTQQGASSIQTGTIGSGAVGGTVVVTTDSSGKLEYLLSGPSTGINYVVQAFQVISYNEPSPSISTTSVAKRYAKGSPCLHRQGSGLLY